MKIKILITVEDGAVTGVFTTDPNIELQLLDYDWDGGPQVMQLPIDTVFGTPKQFDENLKKLLKDDKTGV